MKTIHRLFLISSQRKERNRDKESSANPSTRQEEPSNSDSPVESNVIMDQSAHEKSSDQKDEASPEGKHHQPHVKQSKTADKKAKRSTAPIPTVPVLNQTIVSISADGIC